MIPFSAPLQDIIFSLDKIARADRVSSWDADSAQEILEHFSGFAQDVIAPTNREGDTVGARLENGQVHMPESMKSAYHELIEGGWQGLSAPESHGGSAQSHLIGAGVSEIFSGANHAMQMVCNLVPGAITTLQRYGTEEQQNEWLPKLADGTALATMCITEPSAGSDLSNLRTTAVEHQGSWRLEGEKIFISGGSQDLSDEILHLVLARTGSQEEGVRGLSLFLCRRQPEIMVARIEEKMGLHASPTCQLVFDGAEAELLGDPGAGLKMMFTMMNHARLDVALQGVAHAARARHIASHYAHERKQGRNADGARAVIAEHADIRRMLDTQRWLEMSARAMCHIAYVELELGHEELAGFLTPLCKVIGSEAGIQAANLGIQILGGYGYLEEYELSQTWRDARIAAIYEGANGIHMRSLATRGLRSGGGADAFVQLIDELGGQCEAVQSDLSQWHAMRKAVIASDTPESHAHAFTELSGKLFSRAIWARIAELADTHHDSVELTRLVHTAVETDTFVCRVT